MDDSEKRIRRNDHSAKFSFNDEKPFGEMDFDETHRNPNKILKYKLISLFGPQINDRHVQYVVPFTQILGYPKLVLLFTQIA
jgi:hypothetical protein